MKPYYSFYYFLFFSVLSPILFANNPESTLSEKIPIYPDASLAEHFTATDRQLIVGSELDYPPFALVTEAGKADGYSVDLIKAVAEVMDLDITFRVGPWSEVRAALENREIDILPLVGYSKERDKQMDFTQPHTIVYDSIFIRKEDVNKFGTFDSLKDLQDKKVIVLKADNAHDYVSSVGIPQQNIILADTNPNAMRLLAQGKYDYVLMPKLMGLLIIKELGLDNLQAYGHPIEDYTRAFCFAVKEDDIKLQSLLNDGLNIIKKTGRYNEIYDKWFGDIQSQGVAWAVVIKTILMIVALFCLLLGLLFLWSFSLKKQVNQRTAELREEIIQRKQIEANLRKTKADIEEAYRQAESASRAKTQFLANMSHELRTPLNAILGYAQLFKYDTNLTTKQQQGIQIIQQNGEYLLTLINDILEMTKAEADRTDINPADFDFVAFLNGIVDLFKMRAEEKNIAFIYEPLSYLPLVIHADKKRLRQILINVLSNAVKFTNKGGVTFKVAYQQNWMHFEIEDTGIGISAEDLERVFEPFQQVGEWQHHSEGAGLGLPITKKLVNFMGGNIGIDSRLGQGTLFWIDLNLPEVTDSAHTALSTSTPVVVGYEGNTKYILVVDDKWENRSLLIDLLTPLGFEVMEAANGKEGMQQMTTPPFPDLVITDLVMPIMDGFELTRQIRKTPAVQHIPIITSSASVFEYAKEKSSAAGCNDFLSKPIHGNDLIDMLGKHLNLKWQYEVRPAKNPVSMTEKPKEEETVPTTITYPLNAEQASIFFNLGMEGDISSIIDYAEQLEKISEELKPLMEKIKQCAQNFDTEKVCDWVEPYLNA